MGVKNESALKKCTILYLLRKVNLVPAPKQLIIHKMKCESKAKKSLLGQHKMQQLGSANLNDNFHGWLCSAVIDYFFPQQQRTGEIATTCQQKKGWCTLAFLHLLEPLGKKKQTGVAAMVHLEVAIQCKQLLNCFNTLLNRWKHLTVINRCTFP